MSEPETLKLVVDVMIPLDDRVVPIQNANKPFEEQWALLRGFVETC